MSKPGDEGRRAAMRHDLMVIEGDARVSCRRLQALLGFSRIDSLHRIIKSHRDELEDFGEVFARESKNPSEKGGRPVTTYYLNEHQATAVCLWAETPKARQARRLIVEVFTAWRRGEALPAPAPERDAFEANAARVGHVADHIGRLPALDDFVLNVTHLPIWKNGRRPAWWHDIEVRTFLTAAHRQMSTLEVERQSIARFGARSPRKTSIHAYWMRLDRVLGPGGSAPAISPTPKKKDAA